MFSLIIFNQIEIHLLKIFNLNDDYIVRKILTAISKKENEMKDLTVNTQSDMDNYICSYIAQGFMIAHKTEESVTLTKKKEFNWVLAGVAFLCMFVGLFVYLAYYNSKKDEFLTIKLIQKVKAA